MTYMIGIYKRDQGVDVQESGHTLMFDLDKFANGLARHRLSARFSRKSGENTVPNNTLA